MVLNFSSTGEYAQAVYGGTNSQVAGANGAIATTNPNSAVGPMQGGRNQSRRNQSRRNQSRRNQSRRNQSRRNQSQLGGKRRQQSQRRQQNQRRQQSQRRQQRQRGGK